MLPSDEPKKISMWKRFFQNIQCHKKIQYGIYAIFLATVIVLISILVFKTIHHETQNFNTANHRGLVMLNELHDLHEQLQKIADHTPDPTNGILSLTAQLEKIEHSVSENVKTTDIKKIGDQLMTIQSDLSDLEKTLSSQWNAKKYTDAKALPFEVNYLDMISGHPFVSVDYDHHVAPLGIGDSLNGWTLSAADYSGQSVEFSNANGQSVKINLGNTP